MESILDSINLAIAISGQVLNQVRVKYGSSSKYLLQYFYGGLSETPLIGSTGV